MQKKQRIEYIVKAAEHLRKVADIPQSQWDREDTEDLVYAKGFLAALLQRQGLLPTERQEPRD